MESFMVWDVSDPKIRDIFYFIRGNGKMEREMG